MTSTYLIAALVTLAFTIVLTVAGLGAAFILVPVYLALGVELHSAQATALLLNAIAMAFACARYIPAKLVDFRIAIPIVIVATIVSPLGAYTSSFVPVTTLKWMFIGFLVFAGAMMLFYRPKPHEVAGRGEVVGVGLGVGGAAGSSAACWRRRGNFSVPALVRLGLDPNAPPAPPRCWYSPRSRASSARPQSPPSTSHCSAGPPPPRSSVP